MNHYLTSYKEKSIIEGRQIKKIIVALLKEHGLLLMFLLFVSCLVSFWASYILQTQQ